MDKKNIAIIGLGNIAGGYNENSLSSKSLTHAKAILRNSYFDLAGCLDVNKKRLSEFSKYWKIKNPYSHINEIEKGFYDVIVISSPSKFHTDHIFEVLELNPKVIVAEKPLTFNNEDSKRIQNITSKSYICVNYLRNWDPNISELYKAIRDDNFDGYLECRFSGSILNSGSHMINLLLGVFDNLEINTIKKSTTYDQIILNDKKGFKTNVIQFKDQMNFQIFELSYTSKNKLINMLCNGKFWQFRDVINDNDFPNLKYLNPSNKFKDGALTECMDYLYQDVEGYLKGNNQLKNNIDQSLKTENLCREILLWEKT